MGIARCSSGVRGRRSTRRGMENSQPIVLLHLSDLHFGSDGDDQKKKDAKKAILSSLLKKLASVPPEWSPSIVCISGDIGCQAKEDDYRRAEDWLRQLLGQLELTADDLILCPGNHDVDRKKVPNYPDNDADAADDLF